MHELPFQTITQFAALGLTLVAGWFLGMASAPGGRKWRERYMDEELENAGYRDRAESDLRDAARRIRELEAENADLKAAVAPAPAPAPEAAPREGHSTAAVIGAAAVGAVAGAAAAHAADSHAEHAAEEAPALAPQADPVPEPEAHAAPAPEVHAASEPEVHQAPASDAHPAPPAPAEAHMDTHP